MVWLFVPYAYSCTILLLCASNIYIAITNTALLFALDHVHSTAICSDALRGLMHSDKLIIFIYFIIIRFTSYALEGVHKRPKPVHHFQIT